MVLSAKSKNSGGGGEGWGTAFLLIFFPEDENFSKKKTLFSLSSSSSPSSPFSTRSPSASAAAAAPLISKTRSTLSICGLLVFTTLLLFTLSTFEPTTPLRPSSRRLLLTNHHPRKQSLTMQSPHNSFAKITNLFHPTTSISATDINKRNKALQGMGTLYRRGTKSMSDLIVGHVKEDVSEVELRGFIRMLHHNGLLSRSDLVLIYHSPSSAAKLSSIVEEENESFLKLVCLYREMNNSTSRDPVSGRYLKTGKEQDNTKTHGGKDEAKKKEEKESVWGKGSQKTINSTEHPDELTQINYGSLVGFDASELDPENSLSGFLDHVPLNLRRWAVYPMLLGRVRRYFKHMMLVDIKDVIVLHDPLTRIRNQPQESLFLWTTESSSASKHDKKKSSGGKMSHHRDNHQKSLVFSSSVMVGGSRGVRRFANAVLNEIVHTTIERKGRNKNSVSESGLVNQLLHNGYVLKNVNLVEPGESIRDVSSISGLNSLDSAGLLLSSGNNGSESRISVVERGHSNSSVVDSVIRRVICSSSELYSSVYKDCVVDQ